ncbi:hypothetical protein [Bacillus infantis]|uniref:hypothetical protein n=1 Tax=Bacillus infantis TaxID=324767 RepID=UPI003CE74544
MPITKLPETIGGRNIHERVIPTVCNLENMINKLFLLNGDVQKLNAWEKSCFKAYCLEKLKLPLLVSGKNTRIELLREHILKNNPKDLGANCICIYLVAYVSEKIGGGRNNFFEYVKNSGISEKAGSAQAMWQVGKRNGVYLKILNDDGSVRDWEFFSEWLAG